MEKTVEAVFFEELCQRHYRQILQYILVKVHCYATAEDLAQNVFTVAWENCSKLMQHENPVGFLYVTAQNLAFVALRQGKKAPLSFTDAFDPPTPDADVGETLFKAADAEIDEGAYVPKVFGGLPRETKDLYREYYVEHHSVSEIAEKNGVSEVSVRMRLVRLRKRVKKEVAKQNFDLL